MSEPIVLAPQASNWQDAPYDPLPPLLPGTKVPVSMRDRVLCREEPYPRFYPSWHPSAGLATGLDTEFVDPASGEQRPKVRAGRVTAVGPKVNEGVMSQWMANALGPDNLKNTDQVGNHVLPGNRIWFLDVAALKVRVGGYEYWCVDADQILALEPEPTLVPGFADPPGGSE